MSPARAAAHAGIAALVLLGAYLLDFADLIEEHERAEVTILALRSNYVTKKRQALGLDLHRQQLREIDARFGEILRALPASYDREMVDVMLAARGRGLTLRELQRDEAESVRELHAEIAARIRLSGPYHQLGAFAADIAALPGSVMLRDVTLEATPRAGELAMEATVRAFRHLDDAELAARRKAAQKGRGKK